MRTAAFVLSCCVALAGCGEDPTPAPKPTPTPSPIAAEKPANARAGAAAMLTGSPDGEATDVEALAPLAEPGVAGVKEVPDTMEAFHARIEQLLAAVRSGDAAKAEDDARELLLPNPAAWFAHAFGKDQEHLDALVREYADFASLVTTLPGEIQAALARKERELLVERFIDPGDELATGFQAVALRNLTQPLALYSFRLLENDAAQGWHLWSFAHVDGRFRIVGQMTALAPEFADQPLRRISSWRVRDARAYLKRVSAEQGQK